MKKVVLVLLAVPLIMNIALLIELVSLRNDFNGFRAEVANTAIDPANLYGKAVKSVVRIEMGYTRGAGFVYGKSNLIVTAYHVVEEKPNKIIVEYFNGAKVPANLVGYNEDFDIAILEVASKHQEARPLTAAANVNIGEPIITIGHPDDFRNSLSVGLISGLKRQLDEFPDIEEIQIDITVNYGSSGSPVLNRRGEVIGIANRMTDPFTFGFAIPIEYADRLLKNLP